jgi:CMP-N-acetylneuraminic acid synthetase
MTLKEIREKAKFVGIKNITRFKKENLIRVIQETEGNSPCFKEIHGCGELQCLWHEQCQN